MGMTDIPDTLGLGHSFLPVVVDSAYQLILCQRLYMPSNVEFHFPPNSFSRVHVSTTCWGGPPIDSLFLIKFFCFFAGVLWIIALHESVSAALKVLLNEWQEMVCQNPNVN